MGICKNVRARRYSLHSLIGNCKKCNYHRPVLCYNQIHVLVMTHATVAGLRVMSANLLALDPFLFHTRKLSPSSSIHSANKQYNTPVLSNNCQSQRTPMRKVTAGREQNTYPRASSSRQEAQTDFVQHVSPLSLYRSCAQTPRHIPPSPQFVASPDINSSQKTGLPMRRHFITRPQAFTSAIPILPYIDQIPCIYPPTVNSF